MWPRKLIDRFGAQRRRGRTMLQSLGPGLIAGAADDDPSGITTYTQAGALYGYGLLWTTALTLPLMVGIQLVSARIGWATRRGIAANLRVHYPRPLVFVLVGLLTLANTFNLGADLAVMAEVTRQLLGRGSYHVYLAMIAIISLGLQVWLPFKSYAPILKLLTLSLLSYVGVLFVVSIPWATVVVDSLVPRLHWDRNLFLTISAVLGTTISPYLFFWQASHEAEEQRARDAANRGGAEPTGRQQLRRIKLDTWFGMIFSNGVAAMIIIAAAATLHGAHGHGVESTAQAAAALRPLAGNFAYLLFSLGIIGAGLLAVPVLAGSSAYAIADACGWPASLALTPNHARGFYAVLSAGFILGALMEFQNLDPVRELFWAAVLNGIISAPIMIALMLLVQRADVMGTYVARWRLRVLGWIAVALMSAAMLLTLVSMLLPNF
jgi:Mn2+/Fe2+ NRAMP family transporter